MAYVEHLAEGATELDRVYGLRPEYYALFMKDYLRSIARIEPVIVELCRLRMATLIGSALDLSVRYTSAVEAGLTEDKVRALGRYQSSALFSEKERRCLDFAEQFVIQSSSIADDDVARLQSVMNPEEFIYFVKALSVMDQLQRGCAAFAIAPGATVPATMAGFQPAPARMN